MKKKLLLLSLVGVCFFFSCDNAIMDKNSQEEDYYPFEVFGISHSINYHNDRIVETVLTWTNPDDENFSHVALAATFDLFKYTIKNENSISITLSRGIIGDYAEFVSSLGYEFKCVDINGRVSKGVPYSINFDEYNGWPVPGN